MNKTPQAKTAQDPGHRAVDEKTREIRTQALKLLGFVAQLNALCSPEEIH